MAYLSDRSKNILVSLGFAFAVAASVRINSMDAPAEPEVELTLEEQYGVSFDDDNIDKRDCLVITEPQSEGYLLCRENGFTNSGLYLMRDFAQRENHTISSISSQVGYNPK